MNSLPPRGEPAQGNATFAEPKATLASFHGAVENSQSLSCRARNCGNSLCQSATCTSPLRLYQAKTTTTSSSIRKANTPAMAINTNITLLDDPEPSTGGFPLGCYISRCIGSTTIWTLHVRMPLRTPHFEDTITLSTADLNHQKTPRLPTKILLSTKTMLVCLWVAYKSL